MAAAPVLELGGADLAQTWFEPLCALYDAAFSVPPHHWESDESAQHRERLESLMRRESFAVVVARDGDMPVGFCYGAPLAAATTWWDGLDNDEPDLTAERPGRTFAVIDLAVDRSYRGRGHGRALLETLLSTRSEERATLAVQPQVEENHRFYRHLGWQRVGQVPGQPGESAPAFDLYVLGLRQPDAPSDHGATP